ncbi:MULTISPECIES: hypothetical protein [unclassified Moorena]|uniref:hypothetical protein n=1 Tax=unclassified Moorena TaxID=2683338 RepID=UPI0013FF77AE|nr:MULTISPECIES: hypothetical protein [unclassified Moorena]NEO15151.1 hypothetical protein [Moorena sp. SIO3E8]NEQ01227.1 hypothetical protein [Moorena sp. SIO3F7]
MTACNQSTPPSIILYLSYILHSPHSLFDPEIRNLPLSIIPVLYKIDRRSRYAMKRSFR